MLQLVYLGGEVCLFICKCSPSSSQPIRGVQRDGWERVVSQTQRCWHLIWGVDEMFQTIIFFFFFWGGVLYWHAFDMKWVINAEETTKCWLTLMLENLKAGEGLGQWLKRDVYTGLTMYVKVSFQFWQNLVWMPAVSDRAGDIVRREVVGDDVVTRSRHPSPRIHSATRATTALNFCTAAAQLYPPLHHWQL